MATTKRKFLLQRKPVPSCQIFCLKSLEKATGNYIQLATEEFHSGREYGGILEHKVEASIREVEAYLFHSTPISLCSKVSESFLVALSGWLKNAKVQLDQDDSSELNDSMYIAIRMAEVIANEKIQRLDLSSVPKQIRSCLYGVLNKFTNVQILNMGSGHGGWLSETFCNRFYSSGFSDSFRHLVVLHFHHDCTDYLVELISKGNSQSLKVLDVSFSQNVTDKSATWMAQCTHLQELDVIGSSVSVQAVSYILSHCKKMRKINAMRLALALELIQDKIDFQLQLIECMPETDKCGFVTATTRKHLSLLSRMCPQIAQLSVFSENDYAPLDWNNNEEDDLIKDRSIVFNHLKVLHTWGGMLKPSLLAKFGSTLTELKCVHVEQLTLNGTFKIIFQHCPSLNRLELQNCSIQDNPNDHEPSFTAKLKELSLVSKCSEMFMDRIIRCFPVLEALECGTSTGLSDLVIERNLEKLYYLKVFKIAHSKQISAKSVHLLLDHCPYLREISDLAAFSSISKEELCQIRSFLTRSNLIVSLA